VWDVSIIDTAIKDFYNKSMDTMVEALKMNLTVSMLFPSFVFICRVLVQK
jgi:hypothetical protein